MQPIVRARELHCRRGWGDDRWSASTEDVVLEIKVRAPASSPDAAPLNGERRNPRRSGLRTAEAIVTAWDAAAPNEAGADRQV